MDNNSQNEDNITTENVASSTDTKTTTTDTEIAKNMNGTQSQNGNAKNGNAVNQNNSQATPPAKPTGEMPMCDPSDTECEMPAPFGCDIDDTDCEMPEPPEMMKCDPNDTKCEMQAPPDMTTGGFRGNGGFNGETQTVTTDPMLPFFYMSIGAGSLLISIVLIYACFSKGFRNSPGQTFSSAKKFWLAVLSAIILTCVIIGIVFAIVLNR